MPVLSCLPMALPGWRFRPPRTTNSPELRWVLLRAFGPARTVSGPAPGDFDPHAAVELAGRLSLAARIATRSTHSALIEEVGIAEAERRQALRMATAARGLQIDKALADVAVVVAAHDALFGPAHGPLGRVGQRLRRPVHLVARAAGHALAWRRRSRGGRK